MPFTSLVFQCPSQAIGQFLLIANISYSSIVEQDDVSEMMFPNVQFIDLDLVSTFCLDLIAKLSDMCNFSLKVVGFCCLISLLL